MSTIANDRRPEYDENLRLFFWSRVPYPQTFNTWIEERHHIPSVVFDVARVLRFVREDRPLGGRRKIVDALDDLNGTVHKFACRKVGREP